MPRMTRRATIALPAGFAAFHGAAVAAGAPASPDAELIRLCGEYMKALAAYNADRGSLEPEVDPLWHAIEAIEAKLEGLQATTMEGLAAKGRVAESLATRMDGSKNFSTSFTGDWPAQVICDLLRMMGKARHDQ